MKFNRKILLKILNYVCYTNLCQVNNVKLIGHYIKIAI